MSPDRHIVVVIGNDPNLTIDLTAFRAVRAQTGTQFTRLLNPTFEDFADHLRRMRMQYGNVPNVHIAAHMDRDGAEFVDGKVSPHRLSEVLTGVRILFLAGCKSTSIGDDLGLVPYVITLMEDVDNDLARDFCQLFWMGIGYRYPPEEAYADALQRLPDVAEYAYLHKHDFLASRAVR